MNGWNYAEGNPIFLTDPSGHKPAPPPYIPEWGIHPFGMNGYIEGESWSASFLGQYVQYHGTEIVYDFVTRERARFLYSGYLRDFSWCGLNTSVLDGSHSGYLGWYEFWDLPIEQEYGGPFINFTSSFSPLSANVLSKATQAVKAIPLGQFYNPSYGWSVFCATTDWGGPFPGVNLSRPQCGINLSLSVGLAQGITRGKVSLPFGVGIYFTTYVKDGRAKEYDDVNEMAKDILQGVESPWGSVDGLTRLARHEAVDQAQKIWDWQANYRSPGGAAP